MAGKLTYRFVPVPDDELHRDEQNESLPVLERVRSLIKRETYGRLDACGGRRQETSIGNALICRRCKTCERSVQRALRKLCDLGIIWIRWDGPRRVLVLGPYVWERRADEMDADIARGQGLLPFDPPPIVQPASVRLPDPRGREVAVMRMAVGAERLAEGPAAVGGDNFVGGGRQLCHPLAYGKCAAEKTTTRIPPPPAVQPTVSPPAAAHGEEEEPVGTGPDNGEGADGAREAHIARGYGPPAHNLGASGHGRGLADDRAPDGAETRCGDVTDAECSPAWRCWAGAWDGSPPLPASGERRQDLQTLANDHTREGPEVLAAAIRAGRKMHRTGRLKLFDLRRYCCSGIRATCIQRGRAAVAAAREARRVDWQSQVDDEVARRMREARAVGGEPWRPDIEAQVHAEIRAGRWPGNGAEEKT